MYIMTAIIHQPSAEYTLTASSTENGSPAKPTGISALKASRMIVGEGMTQRTGRDACTTGSRFSTGWITMRWIYLPQYTKNPLVSSREIKHT